MIGPWQAPLLDPAQVEPIRDQEVSFIGDVHGWISRLEDILPRCPGHLIFLGDLIDRGPDSRAVVARVRELMLTGRASAIIGNHEYALVRGLGLPAAGIPGNPHLYTAWCERYGGDMTARSYGIDVNLDPCGHALREAMADDLEFLAELPWYLWGHCAGKPWLAIHAGLEPRPLVEQLEECARPHRWQREELPRFLYAKDRTHTRPCDAPAELCLISGHTPQPQAYISQQRILADTSGGRHGRPLSAITWPHPTTIASPAAL